MKSHSRTVKVLIAEDNEVNMLLATAILENILPQATVIEAINGVMAVDKFKEEKPDIVFMDIRMPEKNGYEAVAEIRKLQSDKRTPIIALTAGTSVGEKERCLEAGMDDYISKPVVQSSIQSAIEKWLPKEHSQPDEGNPGEVTPIHFDEATLKNQLGVNQSEVIGKILKTSKATLRIYIDELHQHIETGNFNEVVEVAHRMKGLAMTACFTILAKLAGSLEEADFSHQKETEELIRQIEIEIETLNKIID